MNWQWLGLYSWIDWELWNRSLLNSTETAETQFCEVPIYVLKSSQDFKEYIQNQIKIKNSLIPTLCWMFHISTQDFMTNHTNFGGVWNNLVPE